jgi:hypothetical protein
VTYLHHIIYVGEHSFSENPTVKQFFEGIIRKVNSQDPDEILTGFMLYYDRLFVHIVEVSSQFAVCNTDRKDIFNYEEFYFKHFSTVE